VVELAAAVEVAEEHIEGVGLVEVACILPSKACRSRPDGTFQRTAVMIEQLEELRRADGAENGREVAEAAGGSMTGDSNGAARSLGRGEEVHEEDPAGGHRKALEFRSQEVAACHACSS